MERTLPPRIRRFAATAAVAFGLQSCGPEELKFPKDAPRAVAPNNLQGRVLGLFSDLALEKHGGSWRAHATYWKAAQEDQVADSSRYIASIPTRFGNSYNGIFDTHLAREFARDAFRAYGLEPIEVRARQSGAEAVLDGVDQEHAVGFELRDVPRDSDRLSGLGGSWANQGVNATPSEELDDDETTTLREAGLALHVSEPEPRYDGDDGTAVTTWMLGLIDFLNEVTDGPDFDLGLVLEPTSRHIEVTPIITRGQGAVLDRDRWGRLIVESDKGCTVELRVDESAMAAAVQEYRLRAADQARSSSEAVSWTPEPIIQVQSYGCTDTLVQFIDGEETRVARSRFGHGPFVYPDGFNPGLPFHIELDCPPGGAMLSTRVQIHRE